MINNFPDDDFYYTDFEKKYHNFVFNSKSELKKKINKDLKKCYARITSGKEYIIKKTSKFNFYDTINWKKDWSRINLQFKVPVYNKDGEEIEEKEKIKSISLNNYVISELKDLPSYSELVFDPKCKPENKKAFNLWQGYKAKKIDKVDIKIIEPVLNHIREILCNNDPIIYNYFISWLKRIATQPWFKTRVMIIFFSEGFQIGKGTIFNFLCQRIFGEASSIRLQGLGEMTQHFNSYLTNKIFTFIDEISTHGKEYYGQFEKVKGMITESKQTITSKGKDSLIVDNHSNYCGATNMKFGVYIPPGDERLFPIHCNEVKKPKKYLQELNFFMENDVNLPDHFFSYLCNYEGYNELKCLTEFQESIPKTQLKKDMIENNLPSPLKFLNDVKDGIFILENLELKHQERCKIKNLFANFNTWCSENKEPTMKHSLFKSLIFGKIEKTQLNSSGSSFYNLGSIKV